MRFPITHGRLGPLLSILGLLQRWSWIEVGPDRLIIRMSWAFSASLPNRTIVVVEPYTGSTMGSIGVHGWSGRWLVNGTTRGLVSLEIEPAGRARVIGFPVGLRQLVVSVDEPERFMHAVREQLPPGSTGG